MAGTLDKGTLDKAAPLTTADIADLAITDAKIASHISTKITGLPTQTSGLNMGTQSVTLGAGSNIVLATSTGTQIGTGTTQLLAFYGTTPVVQPTALTVADAVAIDATFDATEQTTMINMRTRINEIETKLQALGLLA